MSFEINKNIRTLIEKLGMSVYEFSKSIGNKRPDNIYNIVNEKVEVSATTLNKIFAQYPEYKHFVLTGEGEMLKNATDKPKSNVDMPTAIPAEVIPLLPISAQGGTLNDFVVAVKDSDCERVISPIKGADFAITVSGDSMAPEYPSGSQIIIKKINEHAFIDWGKVYVLDTCNGVVIKRLMPADNGDASKVKCVSINPAYPPFEVNLQDVYGVYRVMLCMSMK